MKKFWLVLLSLGLVMAFSVSAFAVDVKVSAEYYAAGLYLNKIYLEDGKGTSQYDNPSTAFFFQRLRVGTDFVVSPCLKLVTRFDAMERIWGGQRSDTDDYDWMSAGTRAESENIAFDVVYIDYTSPIGQFHVGYMPNDAWGTVFGNYATAYTTGQITYMKHVGQFTIVAGLAKDWDESSSAVASSSYTDRDVDIYRVGGIYNFNTGKVKGEAGIQLVYERDAYDRPESNSYLTQVYAIQPYFKAKVGPVDLQGEIHYFFGDYYKYEDYSSNTNMSISAMDVFLDATANLGMFYVGGSFAYLSGDDYNTEDKYEGGWINSGGLDWNPCLILFNNDTLGYWVDELYGFGPTSVRGPMENVWFFQGRVGVKPTPQLDAMLSVSYAKADKALSTNKGPTPNLDYGTEIDITGTYKITNNLSYMLGFGYLFTGDLLQGCGDPANRIVDDFILINKLTLTF